VLAAAYLLQRRKALRMRNAQTWTAIVRRLLVGVRDGATSAEAAEIVDEHFTREAIAWRVSQEQGRRELFREAGVMLEMADYAEKNEIKDAGPVAANLRSHATAIRIATLQHLLRMRDKQNKK
jgi:hypothetical protein